MLRGFQLSFHRKFCNRIANRPPITPAGTPDVQHQPMNNMRLKKSNSYIPNFEFTIAQAGLVIASGLAILGMVKMGDIAMERRKRASQTAVTSEEKIGKPKLGGAWTLYDCKTAMPLTTEDLKGKFTLLYFGFTYCPDICPEEMQKQAKVVDLIDKEMKGTKLEGIIQPVFITVDPRRDTLAQVRMYIKEFHPRLIGLTGPQEQVKKVTRLFRVYYNEGIKTSNADGEEDYLVDHSIIHYLMGPDNEFVDFYGKNYTAEEMAGKIVNQLKNHEKALEEQKQKRNANKGVIDI
jgi:protein SCO1/2